MHQRSERGKKKEPFEFILFDQKRSRCVRQDLKDQQSFLLSLPAVIAAAPGRNSCGGADLLAGRECLGGWLCDGDSLAFDFGLADGNGLDL